MSSAIAAVLFLTLPEDAQRALVRERLGQLATMPAPAVDRIGQLLPPGAQQPYRDLVAALRKAEATNGR